MRNITTEWTPNSVHFLWSRNFAITNLLFLVVHGSTRTRNNEGAHDHVAPSYLLVAKFGRTWAYAHISGGTVKVEYTGDHLVHVTRSKT